MIFMIRYSVIPVLGDILNESVKEKVTRITLAVFRNLIEKVDDPAVARENSIQMVQCKVRKRDRSELIEMKEYNFDSRF